MKFIEICILLLSLKVVAYAQEPLDEVQKSDIKYATPKLAIEALRNKQGVDVRTDASGWIVAYDKNSHVIWSFSPTNDPSYPSMVKRTIVQSSDGISIKMDVRCGGDKEACDTPVRQFLVLNEKIKQSIKNKPQRKE